MAKKQRTPVHGWGILDKPYGMTSTQAVGKIRFLFNAEKAGHGGTLDPLATGLLPIALGEATKTVSFVMDGTKVNRFTVRWGAQTATDDAEGEVIARADGRPTRAEIEAILPEFIGEIMQVPPKFSAIKIGGERAYDLARAGEAVRVDLGLDAAVGLVQARRVQRERRREAEQLEVVLVEIHGWCAAGRRGAGKAHRAVPGAARR